MATDMDPQTIRGSKVVPNGTPAETFPAGRVCGRPGCITRLSQTNPGPLCRIHTPAKKVRYMRFK